MNYDPEDVTLQIGITEHTNDCASHKTNSIWLWVSKEEFCSFVNNYDKPPLVTLSHFCDTLGFHTEDDPRSEMVAQISYQGKNPRYGIPNPDYKKYDCDCNGEVIYHKVEGYAEDTFLTVGGKNDKE